MIRPPRGTTPSLLTKSASTRSCARTPRDPAGICDVALDIPIGGCDPPQPAKSAAAPMLSVKPAKFLMCDASKSQTDELVTTFGATLRYPSGETVLRFRLRGR